MILCTSNLYGSDVKDMKVEHFTYQEHDYIIFNDTSIVHDPECNCKYKWAYLDW